MKSRPSRLILAAFLINVVVGEVWICSGQSNMEWHLHGASNSEQERVAAQYPLIRHAKIHHATAGANIYNREGLPASPFRTDDW